MYYTYLFDEINDVFNRALSLYRVPEGYELVESPEHKKERLEKEIEEEKRGLEFLEKRITELSSKISAQEKELKALNP